MPCGIRRYTSPDQPARRRVITDPAKYEAERTRLMGLILGDDFGEMTAAEMAAAEPQLLDDPVTHELLHDLEALEASEVAKPTLRDLILGDDETRLSISNEPRQSAADWLKSFTVEGDEAKKRRD